ncbi:MAG: DUF2357 domain-containing protein [Clostridia bacterium]|nr:DUF2357 domain-containing protein [Clostridia bacterium]
MADNKLTREIYLNYAKKIVSVLYGDEFFNQYKKRVESGYADFKLVKKRLIQDISIDWISTIEQVLPNLDTIVRNPRKFIVQEEDIVDISLCKAISTESVKHLAQHTNMISKVDKDGTVTPSRILNITKEESYEIYENRFIYTLLLKLKDFVSIRYDKIKKASATQDVLQLNVDSKFNLPSKKVTYRTEYMAQLSFDEVMRMDAETLEKIERIAKIDKIITDFLASSFAKAMRNSAPVRPPITRTNVILKEPNFKKALTLWQFIETYQATGGFSTSDDIEDIKVETESQQQLRQMVTLNTMLFESLYDQHETDMDLDDAQFTDLLRVGDLDFAKDEIQRDEFAQKLEEEKRTKPTRKKKPKSLPLLPKNPKWKSKRKRLKSKSNKKSKSKKKWTKTSQWKPLPRTSPKTKSPMQKNSTNIFSTFASCTSAPKTTNSVKRKSPRSKTPSTDVLCLTARSSKKSLTTVREKKPSVEEQRNLNVEPKPSVNANNNLKRNKDKCILATMPLTRQTSRPRTTSRRHTKNCLSTKMKNLASQTTTLKTSVRALKLWITKGQRVRPSIRLHLQGTMTKSLTRQKTTPKSPPLTLKNNWQKRPMTKRSERNFSVKPNPERKQAIPWQKRLSLLATDLILAEICCLVATTSAVNSKACSLTDVKPNPNKRKSRKSSLSRPSQNLFLQTRRSNVKEQLPSLTNQRSA